MCIDKWFDKVIIVSAFSKAKRESFNQWQIGTEQIVKWKVEQLCKSLNGDV